MAIKPHAESISLKEQIIEDPASGLTLQLKKSDDGTARILIFGDLPYGNREFIFDEQGALGATGTCMVSDCRATWFEDVI